MTTPDTTPDIPLTAIVDSIARDVIEEDIAEFRSPPQCSFDAIMLRLRPLVTQAMRQLAIAGKYRASININKVPLLMLPQSDTPPQ